MSEVPRTLNELKVQIGKNILTDNIRSMYGTDETLEEVVSRASHDHHIEAAERWRIVYPEATEKIGLIAQRALGDLPGEPSLAMSSILGDIHMFTVDLAEDEGDNLNAHIGPVFRNAFSEGPERAKECLEALVAYANGE